jgi:hypothetical protein
MGERVRHDYSDCKGGGKRMPSIFYIIGVVVVVLAVLGYFRLG